MKYILGINAYHGDAAAVLLRDHELLAAAEEERFTRIKHNAGFPANAISYCLKEAAVQLRDVSHIAVSRNPSAHWLRRIAMNTKKALLHLSPRLFIHRCRP